MIHIHKYKPVLRHYMSECVVYKCEKCDKWFYMTYEGKSLKLRDFEKFWGIHPHYIEIEEMKSRFSKEIEPLEVEE